MDKNYARWFRASTPYIRAHGGRTFVVLLGDDALQSENLTNIVHDLALLHVLGVRLVLVHDVAAALSEPVDAAMLDTILGSIGMTRSRLEALFSTGIPKSALRNSHISLVTGNLVTAKPKGIEGGIDQLSAGLPRRVHVDAINALLDADNVVLASPVGYSSSGAAFTIEAETLAVTIAATLCADKLIIYDQEERAAGIGDLTTKELHDLLQQETFAEATARRLNALYTACRRGVKRAHLVSHAIDGVLLNELFTAEGAGTQVSDEDYRSIRAATAADIGAIAELIRPLERSGALVPRPNDRIEREIEHFLVAELDGTLIGCCALYPHDTAGEIACLVGGQKIGEPLLKAAEARAQEAGLDHLFALTTSASDWFEDHGFIQGCIEDLPASRKTLYNYQRNSTILIKPLNKDS